MRQEGLRPSGDSLSSLSSDVGLDLLVNEPRRLQAQARVLEIAVGKLSLSNYRVFIANHDCVRALRSQSDSFHNDTETLLGELKSFAKGTQDFREEALDIIAAHRRNSQTLRQHVQILDLLELPQLMDACVRNGLYDGALDIAAFSNVLERRHIYRSSRSAVGKSHYSSSSPSSSPPQSPSSPSSPAESALAHLNEGGTGVVMKVVADIRESMVVLRDKLLKQLRAPIQLPGCLSAVSSLRRLDTLVLEKQSMAQPFRGSGDPSLSGETDAIPSSPSSSSGSGSNSSSGRREGTRSLKDDPRVAQHLQLSLELKLQLDFLEARGAWLQSELEGAERALRAKTDDLSDAAGEISQWLIEVIDKNRALWFEICTQYRAIFSSDAPVAAASNGSLAMPASSDGTATAEASGTGAAEKAAPKTGTAELVLNQWLTGRIERFVAFLRHYIFRVRDGASLHDILDQTMFFGASLGRLGADFRPLVIPIFEEAVVHLVVGRWEAAELELAHTLAAHREARSVGNPAPLDCVPLYVPASRLNGGGTSTDVSEGTAVGEDPTTSPSKASSSSSSSLSSPEKKLELPQSTLEFPALAHVTNIFLASLNDLRQCSPRSLRQGLEARFVASLRRIAFALARHVAETAGKVTSNEAEVASLVVKEAGQVALPHLAVCLGLALMGDIPPAASTLETPSPAQQVTARLIHELKAAFAANGLLLEELAAEKKAAEEAKLKIFAEKEAAAAAQAAAAVEAATAAQAAKATGPSTAAQAKAGLPATTITGAKTETIKDPNVPPEVPTVEAVLPAVDDDDEELEDL